MSEQDEIVEVKGVPLIVKGGDRDITVKISELEYCITAIRKLKEYKASLMLEQIVARGSTPPAAPVTDRLPAGHVVLEQADIIDGRVSQTVRRPNGTEYERIVDGDEAYGSEEG